MVGLLITDPPGSRKPGRREPAQNVLVSIRPHRLEEELKKRRTKLVKPDE